MRHLTEDELEEVLLGLECEESDEHLAACAVCRGQLEEFRESLELFNQASMAWSEAKSNSMNRDLAEHRIPFRMSVRTLWTCASVLVVLLAGVIGLGERRHAETEAGTTLRAGAVLNPPTEAQPMDAANDATREIASDNAMMQQIDAAINSPEPSPSELYGSVAAGSKARANHAGPVRN